VLANTLAVDSLFQSLTRYRQQTSANINSRRGNYDIIGVFRNVTICKYNVYISLSYFGV